MFGSIYHNHYLSFNQSARLSYTIVLLHGFEIYHHHRDAWMWERHHHNIYTIIVWHASLSHSLTPSITPSLSPKFYSITDKNHHHHRIATCTRDLKSTVVVIIDSPVSYRSFHWIVHARQCTVSGCLTISLLMLCPTRVSVIMGFIAASRRHVVTSSRVILSGVYPTRRLSNVGLLTVRLTHHHHFHHWIPNQFLSCTLQLSIFNWMVWFHCYLRHQLPTSSGRPFIIGLLFKSSRFTISLHVPFMRFEFCCR